MVYQQIPVLWKHEVQQQGTNNEKICWEDMMRQMMHHKHGKERKSWGKPKTENKIWDFQSL